MNTKVEIIDEQNINMNIIKEAGQVIKKGGLVVFPTETVYGLGANALDSEAIKKVFLAKGRPQDNPLIVHISDYKHISSLVLNISDLAKKLMYNFWPGPLTIILKKSNKIPSITSAGLDSIGIRMPSNIIARKLIKAAGVPIAAPSANISGKPSTTEVEHCIEDLEGKVDYIIGGEKCKFGLESTVLDCTVYPPCILRPGAITLEMLKNIDDNIYMDSAIINKADNNLKPKSPGMKYRHYAPKAPVKIISGDLDKTIEKINEMVKYNMDNNKVVGIMASDETISKYPQGIVMSLGSRKNLSTVGYNLFEVLRLLDDKNVDIILSESFDEKGVGTAIMNRLKKSAAYDIINL